MENKNTLLNDLKIIYFSLPCETEDNNFCHYCGYCKNKEICKMIENLLSSLKKYY